MLRVFVVQYLLLLLRLSVAMAAALAAHSIGDDNKLTNRNC